MEAAMRSRFGWKLLFGSLALLVTFALSLPGVKAVRAAEPQAPLAGNDGPTCNQQGPEGDLAQAAPTIEQIRKQIAAQMDPADAGRIVVLNNRGYNYATGSQLEREAVDLERQRAEQ
jgi:hypothetical protein